MPTYIVFLSHVARRLTKMIKSIQISSALSLLYLYIWHSIIDLYNWFDLQLCTYLTQFYWNYAELCETMQLSSSTYCSGCGLLSLLMVACSYQNEPTVDHNYWCVYIAFAFIGIVCLIHFYSVLDFRQPVFSCLTVICTNVSNYLTEMERIVSK